jgi:hypothetical protein
MNWRGFSPPSGRNSRNIFFKKHETLENSNICCMLSIEKWTFEKPYFDVIVFQEKKVTMTRRY